MAKQYWYVIDLDERGSFKVHVEDDAGAEVWEASNEDEDGNQGEFWPVEDGFMKHGRDVAGLEEYLKELGVLPADARLGDEQERSQHGSRMQWRFKQGKIGDSAPVKQFVDSLLAE